MNGRAVRWLWSLVRPSHNGGDREPRLTIVRHHRVYLDGQRPLYRLGVSESVLRQQVALLRSLGLGPLSVTEGLERLEAGRPGHWVAMTFDDGYADNVERALPILTAAGGSATFYLTAGLMEARRAPWWDRVAHALENAQRRDLDWRCEGHAVRESLHDPAGRRRALAGVLRLLRVGPAEQHQRIASLRAALLVESEAPCELATWDQARALVESRMELGAHTLTHPFLDRLDKAEQWREIGASVGLIEAHLGVRVEGLAYPGGAFNAESVEAANGCGLRHAVTTVAGDNAKHSPRFELKRRGFDEGMCLGPDGRFSRRLARAELEGAFDALRRARQEAVA